MSKVKILAIRKIIVLLWIGILAIILYVPHYIPPLFGGQSINILIWPGIFSTGVIDEFEKKSGIKVNVSYFDSNEELLAKIRTTNAIGYDLVIPSDYGAYNLIKENYLKEIDKKELDFINRINPIFLNHYYDPDNKYTIPVSWDVLGLGYNKRLMHQVTNPTWRYIFDPKYLVNSSIIMSNDALESILTGAIYLFGSPLGVDQSKLKQIEKLLQTQKPFVKAYTEFRPDYYLITKNASIALMASIYLWRSKVLYPELDFVIPAEGSLLTIESFAIPTGSTKEELVYKFINYIYQPDTIKKNLSEYTLLPVTQENLEGLVIEPLVNKMFNLTPDKLSKFYFMRYDYFKKPISQATVQNAWIEIKT